MIYKNIVSGELANSLDHVKNILLMKMDPNTAQTQSELTAELDRTVKKSMGMYYTNSRKIIYYNLKSRNKHEIDIISLIFLLDINIAGNTTNYVNKMIEKNLPYV